MLSKELQIGKAGEYMIYYDLIMRGYNAFLANRKSFLQDFNKIIIDNDKK